jgi:hypothetical protein
MPVLGTQTMVLTYFPDPAIMIFSIILIFYLVSFLDAACFACSILFMT